MSVVSNMQFASSDAGSKYGVPPSDPGSQFALNRYTGPTRVDSYSNQNRTTVGRKTTWENQNIGAGGGSWQSFGDSTTPGFKSSEG